ncbi:RES family NAD+ phosphorylase [Peribacillus frigoritolerans]|uniref:RES family NAD+ phosphorylase n=1 Tax=Peribacillus frigoritolerans TaxID=450367 RepID=UPI00344747EF
MKVCCENCFNYEPFKKHIQEKGIINNCSFCTSQNVRTLDVQDIFFVENLPFTFADRFNPNDLGFELERFFTKQIDLLSDSLSPTSAKDLLYKLFRESIGREKLDGKFSVTLQGNIINIWNDFKENIKHGNRFGFGIDNKLKESLIEILQTNEMNLNAGETLFRARLGKVENSDSLPYEDDQIMNPPKHLASEGRINPKGIPYLYLAENLETAIAEVRPYKGKEVSVANVKIEDNIRISSFKNATFHGKTLFKQFELYSLTNKVNMELSKPVEEETKYFNYLPTQYVAELAKHLKFEGLAYSSALENGKNYCLFNQDKASWVSSRLYRTKQVHIEHEPVDSGDDLSSWNFNFK